jgi:DnaJ-domain-containing protein 1
MALDRREAGSGGMNHYEELGVSPSASVGEIRQAYKELARLLHPDQYQDDGLRRAAERQMKRLNQVVAVLSDPAERRRYDLSLAGGPVVRLADATVLAARAAQAARRSWVWLVTAGVAAAGLAYYFAGQAPTRVERAQVSAPAAPVEVVPQVVSESPQRAQRTRREPQRVVKRAAAELVLEPPPELSEPAAVPVAVAPAATVAVAPPPMVDSLAGTWLYVPPRVPGRQGLVYPPEYIELRIIEEPGALFGRYRARYRVTDRALWPEVNFEFDGKPEQATFGWRGAGGARGEVQLKRVGPDRLEVTWWASELGQRLGLASGTAVLVRER